MTTPHAHAAILNAIADGKEIEIFTCGKEPYWKTIKANAALPLLVKYPFGPFRVKVKELETV